MKLNRAGIFSSNSLWMLGACLSLASSAWAGSEVLCPAHMQPPRDPEAYLYSFKYCDADERVILERVFFARTGTPQEERFFGMDGKIYKIHGYNIEGVRGSHFTFEYLPDGSYIRNTHEVSEKLPIKRRVQYPPGDPLNEKFDTATREWRFRKNKNDEWFAHVIDDLTYVKDPKHGYQLTRVTARHVLNAQGEVAEIFRFRYSERPTSSGEIDGYEVFDPQGRKISGYFDPGKISDLEELIGAQDLSDGEKTRRLSVYRNAERPLVAIIDSGYDLAHPDLTYKFFRNPREQLNGQDDDGNGWADDINGWRYLDKKGSGSIWQRLSIYTDGEIPFSHGTHVADIAFRDVEGFALAGFGGNYLDTGFLAGISKFLRDYDVRYSNMSFGFGREDDPSSAPTESIAELQNLIESNPRTIFFVAAGNDDANIDLPEKRDYPASFNYEHILVVGALDTGTWDREKASSYRKSSFSNYGVRDVDFFAPGTKVSAAKLGGGRVAESGTSMASPFALNIALKVNEILPSLTGRQVRDILLGTVYVPAERLPCRTGGMIYPERAYLAAKILKENPRLTVKAAVQRARQALELRMSGEGEPNLTLD